MTVSVVDSAYQMSNEEATCEYHEQRAHFCAHPFSIMFFVYTRLMTWPVVSSVVIRARTFSHNGPEADVVR